MGDKWMPTIKLSLSADQFRSLPRNPAYRYELIDGETWLTPRPEHCHALLTLRPLPAPADGLLRPSRDDDLTRLVPIFMASFRYTQPYGSLDDGTREEAARQALERTLTGGDGPWIRDASFVAVENNEPVGAIFVTLLPDRDPASWESYFWTEPPPEDCIAERRGRPHLTWIFISPGRAGRGLGSALLAAAVNALLDMGFRELLTTFMIGNDSSALWHWRNGFQLLPRPGSSRRQPGGPP